MPIQIIGENIHIISPKVKEALAARDGAFFRTWPSGKWKPAQ